MVDPARSKKKTVSGLQYPSKSVEAFCIIIASSEPARNAQASRQAVASQVVYTSQLVCLGDGGGEETTVCVRIRY